MKSIIQEIQIFGPTNIYKEYSQSNKIILEANENYQKKSCRNRYQLMGPNGIITLSIPLVKGKNNQSSIKEVCISYNHPWPSNHIHTIKTCYGSSPFFIHYQESIFNLLKTKEKYLYDFCYKSLDLMINLIKLDIKIEESNSYRKTINGHSDLRNVFKLNENIRNNSQPYSQVFESKFGFVAGLSILDTLFCLGPETKSWLKNH